MSLYSKVGDARGAAEAYKVPPRNFDIHGEVLKKDKRQLRLRAQSGEVMDILLKKDMEIQAGQTAIINRRDIESIRLFSKEREEAEVRRKNEEKRALEEVGAKDTPENRDSLNTLRRFGADPTKENIETLSSLQKMLENMKGYLSVEVLAELRSKGVKVEEVSLAELEQVVKEVRGSQPEEMAESFRRMMRSKPLRDEEAAKIAEEIYHHEMGKDIREAIKALSLAGVQLNRENIDELHDLFSKLHNIREIRPETLLFAMESGKEISVDLLYTLKNYVRSSSLAPGSSAIGYRQEMRPLREEEITSLEGEIGRLLREKGLGEEYREIAKGLLRSGRELDETLMLQIGEIREAVSELQERMDKNIAALLFEAEVDILGQEIFSLLKLVKELQQAAESESFDLLSPEEQEKADLLLDMVKNLSPEKLLSEQRTLRELAGRQAETLIFREGVREQARISIQELSLLRTASVLRSVEEISRSVPWEEKTQISLSVIGRTAGIPIPVLPKDPSEEAEQAVFGTEGERIEVRGGGAENIYQHYRLLRSSLRSSHVYGMIREGLDPMQTDIRIMNAYVARYEQIREKYSIKELTAYEREELSMHLLQNSSSWKLDDLARHLDRIKGKSRLGEAVQKLFEESEKRGFQEVRERMREVVQTLSRMDRNTAREYEQSLQYFYRQMQEVEELIKVSRREDKDLFERYIKELGKSIRESEKFAEEDMRLQIPFFMGGEQGSANIFAKSGKKGKKQIDPEDMSVLMDLNTKALGKLGFFLKVENREIGIRISASEGSASLMKSQVESLSHLLSAAGYELRTVEITTEQSGAKIAFREESLSKEQSRGLDVRI